jgi:hypothetical protein
MKSTRHRFEELDAPRRKLESIEDSCVSTAQEHSVEVYEEEGTIFSPQSRSLPGSRAGAF